MIVAATIEQALIGLVVAIPSVALAYFGYRRAQKVDRIADQAGIASAHAKSIEQVVDGLNGIILNLQNDNKDLRDEVAACHVAIDGIRVRLSGVETNSSDLLSQNRELRREIVELHAENEDLKRENKALTARIAGLERANGPQT